MLGLLLLALLVAPAAARGQDETPPLPRVVADVQGSTIGFKTNAAVATPLDLTVGNLPGRGLGFQLGAHVYPLRLRWLTLGVGASLHASRAGSGPTTDVFGEPVGHDVTAKLTALSPQVSVNFGSGRGWSYLSGGISTSKLEYSIDEVGVDAVPAARKTLNYGGGARWFVKDHVAFSLDIRFYAISAGAASADTRQWPKMRLLVLSAGVSFK